MWYHVTKKEFEELNPEVCELGIHVSEDSEIADLIGDVNVGSESNEDTVFKWELELSDDDTMILDDQYDWSDIEMFVENCQKNLMKNKQISKILKPVVLGDFETVDQIRDYLVDNDVTQIEYENTEEIVNTNNRKCRIVLSSFAIEDCSRSILNDKNKGIDLY